MQARPVSKTEQIVRGDFVAGIIKIIRNLKYTFFMFLLYFVRIIVLPPDMYTKVTRDLI